MAKRSRHFFSSGGWLAAMLLSLTGLSLSPAQPAMACSQLIAQRPSQTDRRFQLNNGLQLGASEIAIVKTLGSPHKRAKAQLRCPSNRVQLRYDQDTIITLDTISTPSDQADRFGQSPLIQSSSDDRRQSSASRTPVMVSFSTRNPNLRLDQGIQVGDSLTQVMRTYGPPKFQNTRNGEVLIGYQRGRETLRLRFRQNRLDTIEMQLY